MKTRPLLWTSTIFGALAAVLAAGWLAYQDDLRREVERVSSGSQLVDTPCGPIEFAAAGSGPAVLLVHGAGGGFDQVLEFVDQFAGAGFRAVAMSRFGYLRTPLPADASAAAQADAHACLLDALKIERAALFGALAVDPEERPLRALGLVRAGVTVKRLDGCGTQLSRRGAARGDRRQTREQQRKPPSSRHQAARSAIRASSAGPTPSSTIS